MKKSLSLKSSHTKVPKAGKPATSLSPVIQLPAGLPLFTPTRRQAILINSYDIPALCDPGVIELGLSRGSRRVYDFEGILTNNIHADKDLPLSPDEKEMFKSQHLRENAEAIAGLRKNVRYQALSRIQPYNRQKDKLEATLKKLAKDSHDQTLTFLYATSHGEEDGLTLDGDIYSYSDLIEGLDSIKGNKVLVMLACYSGAINNIIEDKALFPEQYLTMTSARADEPGINWSDDILHDIIAGHTAAARPMSNLAFVAPDNQLHGIKPTPQLSGQFDVTI